MNRTANHRQHAAMATAIDARACVVALDAATHVPAGSWSKSYAPAYGFTPKPAPPRRTPAS
ncbi:MAG: hypothetical protein ACKO2C_00995 [Actinomycetes bacterium]